MRGVHIHQHDAVGGLRQDIDPVQLRDRIPQRRGAAGRLTVAGRLPFAHAKLRACDKAAIGILARPQRPPLRQHKARLVRLGGSIEACTAREPIQRRAAGGFGAGTRVGQHPLQRAEHEIMNTPRIAKSYFQLLRVGVDVDRGRIQFQIQQVRGKPAVEQHVLIGETHRARQQLIAHEAAIEKGELQIRLTARKCRQRQPSRQSQTLGVVLQFDDVAGEVLTAYFRHARQALRRGVSRR